MRLGHLEIFVRDANASRRWYEDFGFRVTEVQGGGRFVWMEAEGASILLRPRGAGGAASGGRTYDEGGPALVMYTDDLPAAVARLAERGRHPCGEDGGCLLFRDPDGGWLQLVDPRHA